MRVRASPGFAKVGIADRRWFDRHPDRSYRLRLAAEAELKTFAAGGSPFPPARPGARWWVGVRQVRPGHRLKVYFEEQRTIDLDETEAVARECYERVIAANPHTRTMEGLLARAVADAGDPA